MFQTWFLELAIRAPIAQELPRPQKHGYDLFLASRRAALRGNHEIALNLGANTLWYFSWENSLWMAILDSYIELPERNSFHRCFDGFNPIDFWEEILLGPFGEIGTAKDSQYPEWFKLSTYNHFKFVEKS